MDKETKSFGNRLILNFTLVVFGGFLTVYFLFNTLMDNHIESEVEIELDREIMTFVENEIPVSTPIAGFDGNSRFEIILTSIRSNRAILNVDTILLDRKGMLLLPSPIDLQEDDLRKVETLATFYNENEKLFEDRDEMVMVTHDGHTFYMRAAPHYLVHSGTFSLAPIPVSVLMYTDITPAMNLKNSMNQILLVLLGISGAMSLGISIILSSRFKKSINRLAKHAEVIGQGNFNELIDSFNYAEFDNLASSMNNMSNMLGSYEENQKQFFQNASHELRTPLMSIQGYTEGIQLGVFTVDVATDVILAESKKMTELVDDILYLSRLNEAQESPLNLSSVDINALLTGCLERVRIIAEKANKQVSYLKPTATILIESDPKKLERAIINILTNAIRYANCVVEITTLRLDNELKIIITNDGPLIDEKDLPHLFDRFYKGKGGNTGIGLAITQDIVTSLLGSVMAQNLDRGVQFIITFPDKN
jgi:signal transduction histidine kinase